LKSIKRSNIEKAADIALKIHRNERVEMRKAIGLIADQTGFSKTAIARELNCRRHLGANRKKSTPQKLVPLPFEEEIFAELLLQDKARNRGHALAREAWLQRSFHLVGNIEDY